MLLMFKTHCLKKTLCFIKTAICGLFYTYVYLIENKRINICLIFLLTIVNMMFTINLVDSKKPWRFRRNQGFNTTRQLWIKTPPTVKLHSLTLTKVKRHSVCISIQLLWKCAHLSGAEPRLWAEKFWQLLSLFPALHHLFSLSAAVQMMWIASMHRPLSISCNSLHQMGVRANENQFYKTIPRRPRPG